MLSFYLSMLETEEEKSVFEELYTKYRDRMYAIARKYLHNSSDAEDAVQNAFLRIAQKNANVFAVSPNKQRAFLDILVRNTSIDMYKKNKGDPISLDEDFYVEDSSDSVLEDEVLAKIASKEIVTLVLSLPEATRDTLYLKAVLELSIPDISEKLCVSENVVRQRLFFGRKKIREMIEKEMMI